MMIPSTEITDNVYYAHENRISWFFGVRTHALISLTIPDYFRDAPKEVKQDLINWCRECAIADRHKQRRPRRPGSVRAFLTRPDIKAKKDSIDAGGDSGRCSQMPT